ncbi:mitochondrial import inner membrane translocase subunit TIM50-C [Leptinotarsa decemlineata]|uniref:mitochondrial import inner membrane translocase subunit TIM50-C n=1 Tax=Leptinotarsa decemlineata TaxID=7539 RepID=UPI000C251F97|nr:mitochondrial import inner membrane translocase subunit TIM50-C-like [Leptinotarsa decemlineata]
MIRMSRKSVHIFGRIFKQIVIDENSCRAIVKIPYNFTRNIEFSTEPKSKSPLGNLIAKDVAEKVKDSSEEESKQQREKAWKNMKLTLTIFGVSITCLGGYLILTLGSPEKDLEGNLLKDDLADKNIILQYIIRTYRGLDYYKKLIREPSREKLLPDPLDYPYLQPKYTLVLELTDVLVHPDWTYNTGWRFKKRPLLDYFLESLHGSYEIVIYTAEQGMTVFPLIDAIDPKNIIAYKLVRDATHFTEGNHVKSLNNLNRDLSKVICVDWNAKNVKFNPENLLHVKKWDGNDNDTALIDLAALLKAIVDNDIEDVREVLKYYSKYDDPVAEFREKQKRLLEDLEAQAAAKREHETSKASNWTPNIFSRKSF